MMRLKSTGCPTCEATTQHLDSGGLEICLRCYPDLDPGRKLYVRDPQPIRAFMEDSILAQEIDELAESKGLNPATGERFTLDDIIDRNVAKHSVREKVTVRHALGHDINVPPKCPVLPHLIEHTWCDFADGWYINLVNGAWLQEQPGPQAPSVKHSHGYHSYEPGWHVFGEDGKKILSVPTSSTTYPTSGELRAAWNEYTAHLGLEGTCTSCLGLGTILAPKREDTRVNLSQHYPCHNCNKNPAIHEGEVVVPVWAARAPSQALIQGTWWRYQDTDMVVKETVKQVGKGWWHEGWVVLEKPTRGMVPRTQHVPVWVDGTMPALNQWHRATVLDCMRPALVRAWRGSRALRASVMLSTIFALGWAVGALIVW